MPRKGKIASVAAADAASGGIAAVDKALSVVAAFQSGDGPLTLAELAERTRLYKSAVLRALASLEHRRWVQRIGDGRYVLGSEIARLYGIYSSSFSLERAVVPVLEELVRRTGESASYHVRQGEARICLHRVDSPHPVRDHARAGDVLPLHRGAGGRVLVAFDEDLPEQEGRSAKAYYNRIRKQGYCAVVGDRMAEVAGISAPVFGQDGRLVGALTLTMPAHRYRADYAPLVVDAAAALAGMLP
ncbi:MAG TPA: IclR family transcriptional regulator [Noviherbaspirillum sp.]|jgi:DNA-binding IclR family transcriptional regulator|uniref:IclR family transcriptional regulator n=1 Tax=Noviherbaspirillum sp. TaxID=1926288 RepID=UPI002F9459C0